MTFVIIILTVLDKKTDSAVAKNVKTVLEVTHASMDEWLSLNKNITSYLADTNFIKKAVNDLVKADGLQQSFQQRKIRDWYEKVRLKHNYLGFFIVDRNGINIASSRDTNLGSRSLLLEEESLLDSVFAGNVVSSIPLKTDVPLLMKGELQHDAYSVFTVAPVFDAKHKVVAAFALRIDPAAELAKFIDIATLQNSVKIVPVDRKFNRLYLRSIEESEEKFNPEIAAEVTRILSGNDYLPERPILLEKDLHQDLIGAVLWDPHQSIGLFAYVDSTTAHETYTHTKWIVLSLTFFIILVIWLALWSFDKSQSQLHRSNAWLESVLNSIPSIIFVVDKSGSLKFGNINLKKLEGFRNAIANNNVLHVSKGQPDEWCWEDSMLECVWGPWCVKFISPENHEYVVNFEHIAINDEHGQPVDLVVANDVTKYVGMELEKISLFKQLQQSQKMEAIGQLTGGIAHDFNNMLAAIMGYTQLSLDYYSEDNDKLKEYLTEVECAGKRAQNLVQQMLAYSRKNDETTRHVDPVKTLNESLSLLKSTIPSSIEIVKKLPDHNIEIVVDPVQLQQVIMNLVINSRDAINEKGIVVCSIDAACEKNTYCSSCHEAFSGRYISITIQDTGEGIENSKLAKIFEPFYTSKDVGKGSGMGLSMVHGILHSVGGHIIVNSKPGLGTEVVLLFPEIMTKKDYARQKTA